MVGSLLVADGCTKPLTHQAFEQFQQRLGLERPFESLHTLTRRLSMSQEAVLAAVWSFFFGLEHVRVGSGPLAVLGGLQLWHRGAILRALERSATFRSTRGRGGTGLLQSSK